MTKDELWEFLREKRIIVFLRRLEEEEQYVLAMSEESTAILDQPAFRLALLAHQAALLRGVLYHLTEACMDPSAHQASYHSSTDFNGQPITVCDKCAAIRTDKAQHPYIVQNSVRLPKIS